jgi:hypothetical protein
MMNMGRFPPFMQTGSGSADAYFMSQLGACHDMGISVGHHISGKYSGVSKFDQGQQVSAGVYLYYGHLVYPIHLPDKTSNWPWAWRSRIRFGCSRIAYLGRSITKPMSCDG